MYHHNPAPDPTHRESGILKEAYYEKKHNTLYVQHAFKLNWEFLKERGYFLKQHVVWSNGCNGQFKNV